MQDLWTTIIPIATLVIGWVLGRSGNIKAYNDMHKLVHSLSDMNAQLINNIQNKIPVQYQHETTPLDDEIEQEVDFAISGGLS